MIQFSPLSIPIMYVRSLSIFRTGRSQKSRVNETSLDNQ